MKLLRQFDPKKEKLGDLFLFEGAAIEPLADVLSRASVWSAEQGERVLEANSLNSTVYVVLNGALDVELGPREATRATRGECVGEVSVIDNTSTSAAVSAAERCELLALERRDVMELADRSHAVARNFLRILSRRLRGTNRMLEAESSKAERLALASITDVVTGLYSRTWLEETLQRLAHRADHGGTGFALLLLDVDHFKHINEAHGHPAGDRALRLVGNALRSGLRPTDQAARYGGDEFVILLPGAASLTIAAAIAERACAAVRLVRDSDHEALRLTCSGGTAVHAKGDTPEQLLERAGRGLDNAKRAGGDRVARA